MAHCLRQIANNHESARKPPYQSHASPWAHPIPYSHCLLNVERIGLIHHDIEKCTSPQPWRTRTARHSGGDRLLLRVDVDRDNDDAQDESDGGIRLKCC
jgi:hypothetical protein